MAIATMGPVIMIANFTEAPITTERITATRSIVIPTTDPFKLLVDKQIKEHLVNKNKLDQMLVPLNLSGLTTVIEIDGGDNRMA